jgi:hypothetical protein
MSQILLKSAYFGLMVLKGKLSNESKSTGENTDYQGGWEAGIRTPIP